MDPKTYLEDIGVSFKEYTHGAVFTCEEARQERIYMELKGIKSKNLFLKDRKSRRFYLIVLPEDKPMNIKEMEERLGEKLKFANPDNLKEILGITPGSVSPFGLINDAEHKVSVLIDKEVWDADYVSFHPNINTATLELKGEDFRKYINSLENKSSVL